MLPTQKELAQTYAKYPNDRLLNILYEKHKYRPEALEAARAELTQRKVDLTELESFINENNLRKQRKKEERKAKLEVEHEEGKPIHFFEKLIFFICGLFLEPLMNFASKKPKSVRSKVGFKQRRLFTIAGIVSMLLTVVIVFSVDAEHQSNGYVTIVLLFIVTYFTEKNIGAP